MIRQDSTISHLGFILLALNINTIESIQSFIFYIIQYSLVNLNGFMLLISIGYTFYFYTKKRDVNLQDKNNSPIQLISQLKGYFYIKPILALSLTVTLYSFVGIPPLIGFFAKQMVLTAAIDSGYIFMALIAILTSVISAVYYLVVIKQIFFDKPEEIINSELNKLNLSGYIYNSFNLKQKELLTLLSNTTKLSTIIEKDNEVKEKNLQKIINNQTSEKNFSNQNKEKNFKWDELSQSIVLPNWNENHINFNLNNVVLSSSLTLITSILTIIIIGFMFNPSYLINLSSILAIILFNL